jgi:DNA-binding winged helix-turn-helix (wHTH) protein
MVSKPFVSCPSKSCSSAGLVLYEFGPFELDSRRRQLLYGGQALPLRARAFELLLLLIRDRHRMVTRAELLRRLWPDVRVGDANLSVQVSLLRKLLREDKQGRRYILTLPRRGYVFVGEVKVRLAVEIPTKRA